MQWLTDRLSVGYDYVLSKIQYLMTLSKLILSFAVPARFTKELEPEITVNKGHTITVEVAVLSKPSTQTAEWKLNETVLVDNG